MQSKNVTMGGGALVDHPLRAAVLGELHARPFTPIETPRRILHFGFLIDAAAAQAERAALAAFCTGNGIPAPSPSAKHHRCTFGSATLRWENHAEFSTYTWELPAPGAVPFEPAAGAIPNVMAAVPQPGPLLGGARPAFDRRARRGRGRGAVRPRQSGAQQGDRGRRHHRHRFPARPERLHPHPGDRPRAEIRPRRRAGAAAARRSRPTARWRSSACPRPSASRPSCSGSRRSSARSPIRCAAPRASAPIASS